MFVCSLVLLLGHLIDRFKIPDIAVDRNRHVQCVRARVATDMFFHGFLLCSVKSVIDDLTGHMAAYPEQFAVFQATASY